MKMTDNQKAAMKLLRISGNVYWTDITRGQATTMRSLVKKGLVVESTGPTKYWSLKNV